MAIITLNNNSLSSISSLPAGVGGKVLQVVSTALTSVVSINTPDGASPTNVSGLSVAIKDHQQ